MGNNTFQTPTYYVSDFGLIEAVKNHLEYKIQAVIDDYKGRWKINDVKRQVYADRACATIYMSR